MSDDQNTPATTPEAPVEGAATAALPVEAVQDAAPATVPESPAPTAEAAPVETSPAPEAPVAPEELRKDGPTLEEYVAAGYPADKYPPEGYAVRESAPKADDEAHPSRQSKRTAG